MPPKKNNKKGKKGGDDDEEYWAAKEAALASPAPEPQEEDEEEGGGLMARLRKNKKKKGGNAFANLDADEEAEPKPAGIEEAPANFDDEWPEEDVKPKKGKKAKKAKKQVVESEDEDEQVSKPAVIEDAPANLDDEWPEEDVKPKKGKKAKKSKKQVIDSEDEEDVLAPEEPEVQAAPAQVEKPVEVKEVEDKEENDEGPKLLTKKEKEKLKKEKEKEKKKAQAAAKRAAAGDSAPASSAPAPPLAETEASVPDADVDADGDDHDGDEATAADKKKKKKKKAAAKVEAPPAPAKGKKVPAHILAMQAAVAEKKRIEEEAAAAEAERQRLLEEEDARIQEEEDRIKAQKDAKKQKEKERLERLKKEGKLLTPAEKAKRAQAEARKQALLNAGVQVAGLQQQSGEDGQQQKKKVVYNKKKVPAKPKTSAPASPTVETPPPVAKSETKVEPAPKAEESEDDWDKSDNDAKAVDKLADGVKEIKVDQESGDDWDKSSEDEAEPEPVKAPAPAPKVVEAKPSPAKQASTTASKSTPAPASPAPKPIANGKSAAKAPAKAPAKPVEDEESSEEDSDSSDEESDSDSDSSADSEDERIEAGREKVIKRREAAAKASEGSVELRSPICCILGHVDHGKTRLLDKIRQTSVAEGEAGGITQQIGATFFPADAIVAKSQVVNTDNYEVKIPGLLIIDTPGHEAFANLRTRGSSLCNIAILVVDITQSFEKQTFESLELLKKGKTPFVVALNKIDRLYGWKSTPDNGFRDSLNQQSKSVISEFENRLADVKLRLQEAGLNSAIYDENKKLGSVVSLVPTSAFTGEGIPDMLLLLAKLTQERMNQKLMYISDLSCTILEVKRVEGLGTTLDVILSNGHLKVGDNIVLCGTSGPIVTKVRALLTPQPMRELRIKSQYVHNDEVKAALGVKIFAPGLDEAIAGARVFVAEDEDEESYFKDICMDDLATLERFTVGAKGKGVYVQADTLGALEALLTFLQSNKVPIFDFGIGPLHAKSIRSQVLMAERAPEYACVLAFNVSIEQDAKVLAAKEGLKIFDAPVIYHLFDAFRKYLAEVIEARKQNAIGNAVWPVRLSIIQAFANRDPIILGCDITEGTLRVGTPVGVVRYDKETKQRHIVKLGKILEKEHKSVTLVKKRDVGGGIAVKIERAPYETAHSYGRHFDDKDEVVSLISRQSIDTLKNVFRDQVTMDEWKMIRAMKDEQGIQ